MTLAGRILAADEWTPEQAAGYVRESYARSVEAIIETGARLTESKSRLGHGGWLPMVALLPFSEGTARKLMQIAANDAISNRSHGNDLPASWTTLYALAPLPPAEIEARITAGEITPELDRATAEQWARTHQAAKQEQITAWTEAVDGITRGLSYFASGYRPPEYLPASHVQPDELRARVKQLSEYVEGL